MLFEPITNASCNRLPRHFLTMLKNTSVFIAALAAFGTVVQGQPQHTCKEGLYYCGAALENMGIETLL
ncbi:hypothetical protein E4U15_003456 [Claviceps sp. LM218 group G6]|nr:hypothetical protein E4U15_003456 [Claviceps sp. LM218 group G6]